MTNGSNFYREDGEYRYTFDVDFYLLVDGTESDVVFSNSLSFAPEPNASPWTDLGFALAGSKGDPVLVGINELSAGSNVSLNLTNSLEFTFSTLIVGFTSVNIPFRGGTLVPSVDLFFTGLPTGPLGEIALNFSAPADLPPGIEVFVQHWISDPAGPEGLAASNALTTTSK